MHFLERTPPYQFPLAESLIRSRRSGLILGDAGRDTLYGFLREMQDPDLRIVNMNFGTGVSNFLALTGAQFDGNRFNFEVWERPPYLVYRHIDRYMATHDKNDEFEMVNRGLHESLMHARGVLVTFESQDLLSISEMAQGEYYASSFEVDFAHLLLTQQNTLR